MASAHAKKPQGPKLDPAGLLLGERVVPLYSGALHYFRVAREHWRKALEELRGLGLTMVETYVPWGVHELSEGHYDFGERNRGLDLGAFLDLAHELGLLVFLRPGPNVNSELSCFGLPERVVLDPQNQAMSARGLSVPLAAPPRTFPVPSYASRSFRTEASTWLRAVASIAAPRVWPNGPIALVQVDNEAAFYFRDGPYDGDYHPDALEGFADFLSQRYQGDLTALARAHGHAVTSFAEITPPSSLRAREASELVAYTDWAAYQEHLLCDALAEFAAVLRDSGLTGVPMVHNVPMGEGGLPTSLTAVGRAVGLVGIDYYHGERGLEAVRTRTLRLAGCASPAFAPELGFGAPPWFPVRRDRDSMTAALTALAFGLRGFNLYMAVDRDRWYGAPIDAQGRPRPAAEQVRKLCSALRDTRHCSLTRRVEVALCIPTEYARLSRATHVLGAASPSVLDVLGLPPTAGCRQDSFGFTEPIQLAWHALLRRLDDALCDEHVPFVYVEGETDLETLPGLRVVIAPSYELADRARFASLQRFAARGGVVIHGPLAPTLDERLLPCALSVSSAGATRERPLLCVRDSTEAKSFVRKLCDELGIARPFPIEPRPLRSTVHVDDHGAPRVLFVVNPGALDLIAEIHLQEPLACVDALSDERFAGETTLTLPMRGHSCRMLAIEPRGAA